MWDGTFIAKSAGTFSDHFDVVNIKKDEILGIVTVTVRFHKNPEKTYDFVIDGEDFKADKEAIADEIMKQLQS